MAHPSTDTEFSLSNESANSERYDLQIAVISDTHNQVPERLPPALATADENWYPGDVYHDFKMSLALPQKLISAIYNDKRGIIDFIYPAGFESKESQAMGKYGKKSKSTFRSYWDYSHLIWIQMKHKITKRMKNIIQDNLR